MRTELEALCEHLAEGAALPVHLIDVPDGAGTRYLIVSPAGAGRGALPVSDVSSVWDGTVRVKAVSLTSLGALTDLAGARSVLTPGGGVGRLVVGDRVVTLVFLRHEADYVDDTVMVDTNRRLALSVDSYRMVSVPA